MPRDNEPGVGRTKGSATVKSKWTKYTPSKAEDRCSWDEVSQPLIGELVGAVTRDGDAILLGTTRDGGAFAITVCSGEERIKFYSHTVEEVSKVINDLIRTATD